MLTSRCSSILEMIASSDEPVTINEISEKINKSPRTVRYDLDRIDDYLSEMGFCKLEKKPNSGVKLNLDDEDMNKLFNVMEKINNYDYVLSQKERVLFILHELLNKNNFITINKLSDRMMVSRNTIINDLVEVKVWLEQNKITIKSLKSHGIKVSGNEMDLRKASTKLVFEVMDSLSYFNAIALKLFSDMDMDFIRKTIKTAEEQMGTSFSDDAFNNLSIHIAIGIKRIQLSKDIVMDSEELKNLRKTPEYAISCGIAKMLEERFEVSIPEDEIGYITIHLLGSNISTTENIDKGEWVYLHLMVSTLIENVQIKTGINFDGESQLFDGLVQHVRPAIYRLKHDIKVKNPLIDEIKETYLHMFKIVKESVKFIEDDIKCNMNDEEIAYIILHFMAVMERMKNRNYERPNVLVVCATGIGTSKFVSNKLKSMFDINIIGTISSHGVEKALEKNKNVDLIVTTVPLKVNEVKCIEVNTFLTEKNISDLSLYFAKLVKDNGKELKPVSKKSERCEIDDVLNMVSENCTIHDYNNLRRKLTEYFRSDDLMIVEEYKPSLKKLLTGDFIKLNATAEDWEDAVRKSGQILFDNGCVKQCYIDAMVDTVKSIGPYIVIAPGIAMPHAAPENGVLKTAISMLTLKEPVSFGNIENDPVSIVISICSIDRVNHMNALKELMKFIEDEDFLVKLMQLISQVEY